MAFDLNAVRNDRSDLLDIVRTVAIVMVVIYHVSIRHGSVPWEVDGVEWFFRHWGLRGVDIFFSLSGYLITSYLLTSRREDFVRVFFMRRVFRIVPLYLVLVTVVLAGMLITGIQAELADRIWIVYTFLTAWFIHFEGPQSVPYTITWSLSVEEFAYVILGLLAWLNRKRLPALLFGLTALAIGVKLYFIFVLDDPGFYFFPIARLDSIAIGGITAWLVLTGRRPLLWLTVALAGLVVLTQIDTGLRQSLMLTKLAVATCLVIAVFETALRGWGNRGTRLAAAIGFYSYFTYLVHVIVIEGVYMGFEHVGLWPPFWVIVAIVLAITHGAAVVSYRYFEGPVMRFGRRLEGRTKAPEPSDVPSRPLSRGSP
mgnify:FL=1